MTSAPIALPSPLGLVPGLALTGAITALAFGARLIPGLGILSPLILAVLGGVLLRNVVGLPGAALPGMRFALQRLLRLGVVALGLQLTLGQIAKVGLGGFLTIALGLGLTFVVTRRMGRALGVAPGLSTLIATGTSICGASAVIAANTVVRAEDEDVAYAIAVVTVFGTLAMVAFPLLGAGMTPHDYGLWTGSAIHEVAQVVAAGAQGGPEAAAFATIAKLTRVAFLAPMVLLLARSAGQGSGQTPFPWFVIGFLAMVVVASTGLVPTYLTEGFVKPLAQGLLAMGMAAMGLQTHLGGLARRGLRPLLLGAFASVFLAGLAAALVFMTRGL